MLLFLLGMMVLGACRQEAPASSAAQTVTSTPPTDAPWTPARQDSFERAAADSMARVRREHLAQIRVHDGGPGVWFAATRQLDVTGDGIPEDVRIQATGSRSDSLKIELYAIVDGATVSLATWRSDYELIDPPFPRDTAPGVVDTFIRTRLTGILADIDVSIERMTAEDLAMNTAGGCEEEEDAATCLKRQWGVSTLGGRSVEEVAREVAANPVPQVTFGYGYETVTTIAWVAPIKRFVGISSCC